MVQLYKKEQERVMKLKMLSLCLSFFAALQGAPASTGQDFIKIPATNMTQSEAHMSMPTIRKAVEATYHINENTLFQRLWSSAIKRERQFNDTHYVFYTGFSNEWRVPQDLYLKLYARFHPLSLNIKEFRAFRWMPAKHVLPQELLKSEFKKHGLVNDNAPHLKFYLLSSNVALFGNVGAPTECTIEYFLSKQSHKKVDEAVFKAILDIFGVNYDYLAAIMGLSDKYFSVDPMNLYLGKDKKLQKRWIQTMSQIFIPKDIVDYTAYIAWARGIPYEEKLIAWIHEQKQKGQADSVEHPLRKAFKDITKLFKDQQENHPLFREILKGIEQGSYRISKILDDYKRKPEPYMNSLQARLIMTSQYIGNPGSNVHVFDYDAISQKNKDAYEKELNEITDKIFFEFLEKNAKKQGQQVVGAGDIEQLAYALKTIVR